MSSNVDNEKLVIQWIKESISKPSPFDYIIDKIVVYLSKPIHSISEFKRRSNKNKGDLFEILAKIYLQNKYKDSKVWLLNEIPDEDRKIIGLKKNDYGIDLIIKHSHSSNRYSAVQCKYRNRTNKSYKLYRYMKYPNKNILTWKQLSTFYALCARLEENITSRFTWNKLVVFTNCDYVKRLHTKKENDLTIAYKTLINLKTWKDIVMNMNTTIVNKNEEKKEDKEKNSKVRELRMKFYSKYKDYTLEEIEKEFEDYRERRLERIGKIN